jgi:hypothetical protein
MAKQAPKTETQEVQAPAQTVYEKAYLIANAAVFNTSPEIMAGALYGVDKATKAEAERRLKEFKTKKVNK